MSEIAIIGYGSIAAAFIVTVVTGIAAVIGALADSVRFRTAAEYGAYLICTLFGVASAAMIHAFIHQDYSLLYVYQYSDANMPWIYQLTAFWGGQAGSLLFWVAVHSLFLAVVVVLHRKRDAALMPWVIAINAGILLFFGTLLLFVSNPFEVYSIIDAPADGRGLNPQLQTITMVIHPPSLLVGYVSASIPFSFAMAALLSGRLGEEWLKSTRKWTLISWAFLSVGLILGMLWAYTELGWGGYWAWDPVENAALIPWFVMTAFLHSAVIQEKRGMLKRWNMFLVVTAWLLTIFGTFLTRSGMISSVHSFAASEIGDYFLFFMLTSAIAIYGVLGWRWGALKTERAIESFLSREFAFLFNNWVLLVAAGVVIWGTMFPKIKEILTGDTVSIRVPWFNKFMAPIGLVLLLLMGIGTVISWRRATLRNFQKNFVNPLIFAALVTAVLPPLYLYLRVWPLGVEVDTRDGIYALIAVFVCAFSFATTFVEFFRGTRARMSKLGVGVLTAVAGLVTRNQRRYGGYLVHLGIIMLCFGFVGASFTVQSEVVMQVGEVAPLGDYEVHLKGLREEQDPEKVKTFADVDLMRNGELVAQLAPGKFYFHASQSGTSEVDIRSTPSEDVYFAVINHDVEQKVAALLMVVNPFVWWIWVGGLFMVFGTLVCMWPEAEKVTARARVRRLAPATVVGVLSLLAVPAALLVFESSAQAEQPRMAEEVEVYDTATQKLFELIRCECPGCSGQSIAHCHPGCGHGKRDRDIILQMQAEGRSREDIVNHFLELRGEAVLMEPIQKGFNHLTWVLPVVGAVVTVPVLVALARRRRDPEAPESAPEGDEPEPDEASLESEEARLRELERTLEEME